MRIAVLLVLVACDAGQRVESTPHASPTVAPRDVAWLRPDPWAPTVGWPPAVEHTSEPEKIDPNEILIRWMVFAPNAPGATDESSMLRQVRLDVVAGGVGHSRQLPSELGSLQPYNQVVCGTSGYPLEKGELAKITFYEGGAGGFFLKRSGDFLTISEWSQSDGACEDPSGDLVACPRSVKQVGRVSVKEAKRGAKLVEQIVEVDENGEGTTLECGEK